MDKGLIVYVGDFELPDKNAASHRCIANGKLLRGLGFEVVFLGVRKDKEHSEGISRYSDDFFGFECWSVPYPGTVKEWLLYISGASGVFEFFKSLERPIKAVVCYNYPAFSQIRLMQLGRKKKFAVLPDIADWYDSSSGKFLHRMIKKIDTFARIHIVSSLSLGVITTSKYMTDIYNKKNKVTVELPTLQDSKQFKAPDEFCLQPNEMRRFIYAGKPFSIYRVNKKRSNVKERLDKSIEIFYEIYKRGCKFRFDVIGVSEKDYLSVYPEHSGLVSELSGSLIFHGRQPHDYTLNYLKDAHYSIFFRDVNRVTLAGFPSKLSESIAVGTPVVTNKMLSIERYSSEKSIIQVESGVEVDSIVGLINKPLKEITNLKKEAYMSKRFDYRTYISDVDVFLKKIGVS